MKNSQRFATRSIRGHTTLLLCVLILSSALGQQKSYYVDALQGSDTNDGRTAATAWKSLEKCNATAFQPGDSILLKSGAVWTGQFAPRGSGDSSRPIVVNKYGVGVKPRIDGAGLVGTGVVYLINQQYWEINNLDVTNDASTPGDRRGVYVAASNFGLVHHIYLRGLSIHAVRGLVGDSDTEKRTGGIGFETTSDGTVPTRFDDILIEGCTIDSVDNTGLFTDNAVSGSRREYPGTGKWPSRAFTNARVRNNVISHIAKNAMIIRFFSGGVVEYNVCYETALKTDGNTIFTSSCNGPVFQFNEGYLNRARDADGSMYDADLRSPNTIWQYSYSHDNAHGLFWTCTNQADSGIVCRYNISQNDKGIIFCINYPNTAVTCYNNTVYCGTGVTPTIIAERNVMTGTRTYYFYNNVIYNKSTSAKFDFRTTSTSYTRKLDYNVLYGFPSGTDIYDSHLIVSDPKLVAPGSGGIGIATLSGYRLQAGSPCIDAGLPLENNGGRDYWGGTVPVGQKPDRGACEYSQATGMNDHGLAVPSRNSLFQNYPNPFNPETNLSYELSTPQDVALVVCDLRGKTVRTLHQGTRHPGRYAVQWDSKDDFGTPVSSGVYVARLLSGPTASVVKMILLR